MSPVGVSRGLGAASSLARWCPGRAPSQEGAQGGVQAQGPGRGGHSAGRSGGKGCSHPPQGAPVGPPRPSWRGTMLVDAGTGFPGGDRHSLWQRSDNPPGNWQACHREDRSSQKTRLGAGDRSRWLRRVAGRDGHAPCPWPSLLWEAESTRDSETWAVGHLAARYRCLLETPHGLTEGPSATGATELAGQHSASPQGRGQSQSPLLGSAGARRLGPGAAHVVHSGLEDGVLGRLPRAGQARS